jgi:hypothetical protein
MEMVTADRWYARNAWMLVLVLALLVTLFGAYVLVSPVDNGDFEAETGVVYDDFSSETPAVAEYLEREARVLAVTSIAFGLLVAGVAGLLLRRRQRIGWTLSWLFPGWMALVAIVFFAADATGLGAFYTVAAALGAGALVAAMPTVRNT